MFKINSRSRKFAAISLGKHDIETGRLSAAILDPDSEYFRFRCPSAKGTGSENTLAHAHMAGAKLDKTKKKRPTAFIDLVSSFQLERAN